MSRHFRPHFLVVSLLVLLLGLPASTQGDRHLTVYAPGAVFSIPLSTRDGQPYVGISDVLDPLGVVEAREDNKHWRLRFVPTNGREVTAEFQDGKKNGKVRNQDVQLSANFHLENGRGYIPLRNLTLLLPSLTGQQVNLREASLRLFLGGISVAYQQHFQSGQSPKLTFSFTAPVNPMVATEPGRIRLVFRRDPLVNAGQEAVDTGDPTITGTAFTDANGTPQITVNGAVPLTATFSDGNKTITIAPVTGASAVESAKINPPATTTTPPPAPGTPGPNPAQPSAPAASTPSQPRFLVILDPAHGGDERGAAITDKLPEKDVNLALARRLQHELQNRGITTTLLRSGDNTVAIDDRATAVNAAHPALYISIHSANLGTGLRIFTALMSPTGVTRQSFLPWHQAQAPYLDASSQVAGSISAELSNRQIPVSALPAPLRPMRNIAAPAIAIEVAPPDDNVNNIAQNEYQQNLAAAVANGIAAMRPKLQGAR